MTTANSNQFLVTVSALSPGDIAVLGLTGVGVDMAGQDSPRAFDDVQVRNGVMLMSSGHNHGYDYNNGIRTFDPVAMTTGYEEPWHRTNPSAWIMNQQPPGYVFQNEYYYTYDNTYQIYLESEDKLIEVGSSFIYDFATGVYTHGNAPPFKTPALYLNSSGVLVSGTTQQPGTAVTDWLDKDAAAVSAWGAGAQFYDGFRAYVPSLDIAIFIGGGTGGDGLYVGIVRRNPNYPATSTRPWMARAIGAPAATFPCSCWSRSIANGVVFDGTKLFMAGALKRSHTAINYDVQILDLAPCATGALPTILTTYPDALLPFQTPAELGMVQLVLDTNRNRVLLMGRRLLYWDLDTNGPWVDITPSGWGYGFAFARGYYYAPHDRIYFCGCPIDSSGQIQNGTATFGPVRYVEFQ